MNDENVKYINHGSYTALKWYSEVTLRWKAIKLQCNYCTYEAK